MILDRLTQAVREQNWFAVVLEVCIVVLGVVLGFQVTAWGDERAMRELRTALSEWEGVLADVTEDEVQSRDIVVFQLEPLL